MAVFCATLSYALGAENEQATPTNQKSLELHQDAVKSTFYGMSRELGPYPSSVHGFEQVTFLL